ncbi:MAG: sigma factor [Eubacteriales bacterium]
MRKNESTETDATDGMIVDDAALVLRAAGDERAREELIQRHEKNILRVASRAKHRFVTKSDDEWSIALCAFSRAIDTYRLEKGAFGPYAETLIRRSLIDAHRAEARHANELLVSPDSFDGELREDEPNRVRTVVASESMRAADTTLRDEILAANLELEQFGFRFFDLTDCSPSRAATREACLSAAEAVLSSEEVFHQFQRTKQLPVKRLIQQHGVAKKLIERYRRYIIAAVVIRAGDYPALNGYMRGGRGKKK